jgi:hypothetical protein
MANTSADYPYTKISVLYLDVWQNLNLVRGFCGLGLPLARIVS